MHYEFNLVSPSRLLNRVFERHKHPASLRPAVLVLRRRLARSHSTWGHFGPHEHYAISCPRCCAVASRRGCQGQPNAPGASPGLRRPDREPVLVPWPEVPSAGWPVRPGAVIHLPAEMSVSASSRACVRVPLIGGILPSPLVISPPRSQRSQGKRGSLLLSHQPGGRPEWHLCRDLRTHWMNAQVSHWIAVDARGCGKVVITVVRSHARLLKGSATI